MGIGHSMPDARDKIEAAVKAKGKFKSVEEPLQQIYSQQRP